MMPCAYFNVFASAYVVLHSLICTHSPEGERTQYQPESLPYFKLLSYCDGNGPTTNNCDTEPHCRASSGALGTRYGAYNYLTGVPEAACALDIAGAIAWITQIATFAQQRG